MFGESPVTVSMVVAPSGVSTSTAGGLDTTSYAVIGLAPAFAGCQEQTRFAPLQITQVTFSNNVRVHYRFMDFKKGEATVLITLAGGVIRESAEQRGLTEVATLALSTPATTRLSSTDIRDIMTGKKIAVEERLTDDTVVLSVAGAPEALEDGLQLAHVLLQEARIEPASVTLWKDQKLQDLAAAHTRIDTLRPILAQLN